MFSVKISPESGEKSPRKLYQKKADYDECIYLIKHTDETAEKLKEFFDEMDKIAKDATLTELAEIAHEKLKNGEIGSGKDEIMSGVASLFGETHTKIFMEQMEKNKYRLHHIYEALKLEAVLNTQQFKD